MNIIKTLIFASIIIFISSCYKDIELYNSDDFESHLVVNAVICADSTISLTVLRSVVPGQLDSTIDIENVVVRVFEDGQPKGTLTRNDAPVYLDMDVLPHYVSDFPAREGHIYTFEIEALGQKVSAELSFPEKVSTVELELGDYLYSDTYNLSNSYIQYWTEFPLSITINDPVGKNYYMLAIYSKNYGFILDTITWLPTDTISEKHNEYGSVSFYDLYNEVQYVNAPLPFSLNYWSGQTIIFNDEIFSEESFLVTPTANLGFLAKNGDNTAMLYYQVITISEDLFNFYSSINKYEATANNPFVEPVNIFSNIEGGIGIVAGYNMYLDSIEIELPIF